MSSIEERKLRNETSPVPKPLFCEYYDKEKEFCNDMDVPCNFEGKEEDCKWL